MIRKIFTIILTSLVTTTSAQVFDSLRVVVGSRVQLSSSNFQPLWSKANLFGMASTRKADQISWLETTSKYYFGQINYLSDTSSMLKLDYGATVFNSEHYSRVVLQQAYAQLSYKGMLIRAGRHRDLLDDLDPSLSVGSLGTSGNALPIPKVTASIDEYINVPFTNGRLQFKGMISHGWMGSNRFMQSFLHEKTFYGQINLNKIRLYGGIQHYVEWGGRRAIDSIYLDRSLRGFLNVLFVSEANDGSVSSPGIRPNRAGDQRGLAELGAYFENDDVLIHLYNQTPFESGKGIDFRNIDRLLGIHIHNKISANLLKDLVFEFIYTKQMESFRKGEKQSYYNNGAMKTGWEYEGYVIGMPIMTNREDGSYYMPIKPFDWRGTEPIEGNANIINNRLVGGNVAVSLMISENFSLRAKMTGVMNYGSYVYRDLYKGGLFQSYSLIEGGYHRGSLHFSLGMAGDFGALYDNLGTSFGIRYDFSEKNR